MNRKFSEDDINKIIQKVSEGETLKAALETVHMSPSTFFKYIEEVPLLRTSYHRARVAKFELAADEILHIADNEYDPQRARNMIDARKWLASKIIPETYGEKLDVNLNQTVDIRGAIDEAKNRIRNVLEIPKQLTNDNQSQIEESSTGSKPAEESSDVKTCLNKLLS